MRLLWRRYGNARCRLAALLRTALQRNRRCQRHQSVTAAVITRLAHVGGKRAGEQAPWCVVVQRVRTWTDIRPVAANFGTVVDLRAPGTVAVKVTVETVLTRIAVPQRDTTQLPVHLDGLVPARINNRGETQGAGGAGRNCRRGGEDGNRRCTAARYGDGSGPDCRRIRL